LPQYPAYNSLGGSSVTVSDGTTTVPSVDRVEFSGATVAKVADNKAAVTVTATALPSGGSVGQPLLNTAPGTGAWGDDVYASDGNNLQLQGGAGSATAAAGNAELIGGNDAGAAAGNAIVQGGESNTTGIAGGQAVLIAGNANAGDADGGDIYFQIGTGIGTGRAGKIRLVNVTSTPGAQTGTLTNSPGAGDPTIWLEVVVDTGSGPVTGYVPIWTVGA
jgi:hypothetical protein